MLFNIWDAGRARAVAASGAVAIATGSWSVAAANGYADGEHVPLDLLIENLSRIVRATDLPVTVDIESGYGRTAGVVAETVACTIEAGAIGCNLEDSFPESGTLRDVAEQVERIRAARAVAEGMDVPYFINARTDVLFRPSYAHDDAAVEYALERARAYADAGADGLFAPGLVEAMLIARLAAVSSLPLNVMVTEKPPPQDRLSKAGVARCSHGPGPYRTVMKMLQDAAGAASRRP